MKKITIATIALLYLACWGLACGGKKGDEHGGKKSDEHGHDEHGHDDHGDDHDDDHDGDAGAAPDPAHPKDAQLVRIAPEMIRDLRVTVEKAEARTAGERVAALGELRVNQDAYAEVAAPSAARVVNVLAKAGDVVKANQPLVELHSADAGRARAEAQAATTRLDLARKNLDRKRALATERLITEREVVEAETAVAEAQAALGIATATLRQYAGTGAAARLVLRAPVGGTVIERDVVVGQLADPSRTLYRIGDLSRLWLVVHVYERDAVRVRIGGTGTASFAALPGKTVDGEITWIGHEVDPASRTIPVRLEIPNPEGVLRPGMSATVSLPLGNATGNVVAVPLAAVQRVGETWAVFCPRGPGEFAVRPIGRGRDLAGEVEVLSGLAPGDAVVVDGAFLLKAEADKARGEGGGHDHHH